MTHIPLFPLPLVIFPGGKLPLRIFEVRYVDMVKHCLRDGIGFGVILITEGEEFLRDSEQQLPSVSRCGTYCTIADFDELPDGMLGILAEGVRKFVIRDEYEQSDRLMMADIEFLADEIDADMPEGKEHLSSLLESLMSHEEVQRLGLACDLSQALEVGSRLTELLPCSNGFKQRMLEIRDPLVRLSELDKMVHKMQKNQPDSQ